MQRRPNSQARQTGPPQSTSVSLALTNPSTQLAAFPELLVDELALVLDELPLEAELPGIGVELVGPGSPGSKPVLPGPFDELPGRRPEVTEPAFVLVPEFPTISQRSRTQARPSAQPPHESQRQLKVPMGQLGSD